VNSKERQPTVSSSLAVACGKYCSGENTTIVTRGTTTRIKTKIYKHDKRSRGEQSSTEQNEDNGSHFEEIRSGPNIIPLNAGIIKRRRKCM
jgi:hypothetical protein